MLIKENRFTFYIYLADALIQSKFLQSRQDTTKQLRLKGLAQGPNSGRLEVLGFEVSSPVS